MFPPKPRPLAEIEAEHADQRKRGSRYVLDRYTVECRRTLLGRKTYFIYDHVQAKPLTVCESRDAYVTEYRRRSLAQFWVYERRDDWAL